jgi:L,D-peptidoglycan transpeptidase YkuD (ErfK/YbiS/YcfS/YnhG family)
MMREMCAMRVVAMSKSAQRGRLFLGGWSAPCALGRAGRRHAKREGDGATPIGRWTLDHVYFRADRVARPDTGLPAVALRRDMGWCDDPTDRNYNRMVRLPYPARHERLWRDDRLYDLIVVLGHNRSPRIRFHGSAIFMHLASPGMGPTEGCIALSEADLRRVLARAGPGSVVHVPS